MKEGKGDRETKDVDSGNEIVLSDETFQSSVLLSFSFLLEKSSVTYQKVPPTTISILRLPSTSSQPLLSSLKIIPCLIKPLHLPPDLPPPPLQVLIPLIFHSW